MTRKLKKPWENWIAYEQSSSFADCGVASLSGMHLIPEADWPAMGRKKEVLWTQTRDPTKTQKGMVEPKTLSIRSSNLWNFHFLYNLHGSGAWDGNDGTGGMGEIKLSSGQYFNKLYTYLDGTEREFCGCAVNSYVLNVPEGGGPLFHEVEFISAYSKARSSGTETKPTAIDDSLYGADVTFVFKKNGTAVEDVCYGGKISWRQNLDITLPDFGSASGNFYEYPIGKREVEVEARFRIDDDNNFMVSVEAGDTGVFVVDWDIKDANSTGIHLILSGMQVIDYTEPYPSALKGFVEQTVTFVTSEDFSQVIEVTGVDFT